MTRDILLTCLLYELMMESNATEATHLGRHQRLSAQCKNGEIDLHREMKASKNKPRVSCPSSTDDDMLKKSIKRYLHQMCIRVRNVRGNHSIASAPPLEDM
ncbi:hypothetical protein NPIL_560601 [Nephila pilipes]|uniref:Uncharacterized protein n=1 Tax=Nephila pilipes TaxID=299642 RepID=A0A8X6PYX6_NEPPI|nr:hypothetical protein NPIL_560601 [Nephila pilipes]